MRTDLLIFLLSLFLTSVIVLFLGEAPFIYDEGSYAIMVHEFSQDPSMVMPTIAGEHAEWKPPLFTWIYTPFYLLFGSLGMPPEVAFRLPSALFASLSIAIVYRISRILYDDNVAIAASVLLLTTPLMLFSSSFIMMEAFSVFLILASIYMYLEGRFIPGMLFLGMLVLTKWLYAIAPLVFLTLYLIRDKELPKVLMSFLIIPVSILLYLVLAFVFSDIGNALSTIGLDATRTIPHFDIFRAGLFMVFMLFSTFPLSLLFAFFTATGKAALWEERHLIALGALAFIGPLSQYFIFWYAIISVPAMAIFVARRLSESKDIRFFKAMLLVIIMLNAFTFLSILPFLKPQNDVKEVASFMKGKDVTYLETRGFYGNWNSMNARFNETEKSFILLEQFTPGILFYRFNDSDDYHNLHAMFSAKGDAPICNQSDYLVTYGQTEIPDCFYFLWAKSEFKVYYSG